MKRAILVFAMAVLGFALLNTTRVRAQYNPRSVSGIVTDKRGNPLPKVAVQLENEGNLNVRSCITDKDGRYHFAGLNDDVDFTLKAKYRNYWSNSKTLSKFDSSTNPKVNLVIPID